MATRKSDATATPQKTRRTRVRVSTEPLTPEEHATAQETFLATYAVKGNVSAACAKAGIHRATVYRWLEHDEPFSMAYEHAKGAYDDALRAEIHRRAHDGVLTPVVSAGKLVTRMRTYSDTLLIFQAKARMPEYRDKQQVDITSGGERLSGIADAINALLNTPDGDGPAHAASVLDTLADRAARERRS